MKLATSLMTLFLLATPVLAQEQAVTNAGLLSSLWYSKAEVLSGDEIKVFGGFYNQSEVVVEGEAVFLVDGEIIATKPFISEPDTLIPLETLWLAVPGKHELTLHIGEANVSLLVTTSDEMVLSIKEIITVEKLRTDFVDVVEKVVEEVDSVTKDVSNRILALKKPVSVEMVSPSSQATESETHSQEGKDLGTDKASQDLDTETQTRSAYNLALTFLSSVVLHWKLTLAAIIILIILVKFTT